MAEVPGLASCGEALGGTLIDPSWASHQSGRAASAISDISSSSATWALHPFQRSASPVTWPLFALGLRPIMLAVESLLAYGCLIQITMLRRQAKADI